MARLGNTLLNSFNSISICKLGIFIELDLISYFAGQLPLAMTSGSRVKLPNNSINMSRIHIWYSILQARPAPTLTAVGTEVDSLGPCLCPFM